MSDVNQVNWKTVYRKCVRQHEDLLQRVQQANSSIASQHTQINQSLQQWQIHVNAQLNQLTQALQQLHNNMNTHHDQVMQNIQQLQQRANTPQPPIYTCNIPIICNPAIPTQLNQNVTIQNHVPRNPEALPNQAALNQVLAAPTNQVPAPGPMRVRHSLPVRHYRFNIENQNLEPYHAERGGANGGMGANNLPGISRRFIVPAMQEPIALRVHAPIPGPFPIRAPVRIEQPMDINNQVEQAIAALNEEEVEDQNEEGNANVPVSVNNEINGPN